MNIAALRTIVRALSPFEYVLFLTLSATLVISGFFLISHVAQRATIEAPERGGSLTEGVIGSPRFINPLLALSDADRDLTALVYSGLLVRLPSGDLIPNLAQSYEISDDGLVYTFILRDDISFHDGTHVSADDIVFTVEKALDPTLKSPRRASWDGVSVEKVDERTVRFILKQPYAPFLKNATLGILPKHLWQEASAEQFQFSTFNVDPVGSGPYAVTDIKRNASGIPMSYTLKAYATYALGRPYIDTITFRFYPNEVEQVKGLINREIESSYGLSPATLSALSLRRTRIETTSLPRIFAIFFNQNQAPLFANKEVRVALDTVIDKERIVSDILGGYGEPIESPIPPGILREFTKETREEMSEKPAIEVPRQEADERSDRDTNSSGEAETSDRILKARDILSRNGWKYSSEEGLWTKSTKKENYTLSFSLATSNSPELSAVAEAVTEKWRELGAVVDLQIFETGDLNQNIIRQRKYDALIFGEIIGRELDLFAFWHSSQRNDPGLNIALYANISADKYLESARTENDRTLREEKYRAFENEVVADAPAVFLYSPFFIYLVPEKIKGLALGPVTTPAERFLNIHEWYIETNRIWKIFE